MYLNLYTKVYLAHICLVWGNSDQIYLEKICKLQKRAVRAITFADYRVNLLPIVKELQILSVKDLFKCKLSSLMRDYDHESLPSFLASLFTRRNSQHTHQTRTATSGKLEIKSTNTNRYGTKAFEIHGVKILNQLMNKDFFSCENSKKIS